MSALGLVEVASAVPPEPVEALLGALRPWCAREVEPAAAGWDAAESLESGLASRLAQMGLFGVSASEADGGAGVGLRGAAWVVESIAAASGSLAAAYAVHEAAAVAAASALQAPAERAAALRTVLEAPAFFGWLGPQHDVELSPLPGGGARVRGRVGMALAGTGPMLVAARAPEGAALVRVDAPGARAKASAGLRGAGWVELELDRELPAQALWLRGELAERTIATIQARLCTLAGALACGVGRATVATAARYAKQREQFGQAIAQFQATQWKLADGATARDAAWLLVLAAAAACDGDDDGVRVGARAATAQLAACRAAVAAGGDAIQIHGGYGYTREFPVERHYRDARAAFAIDRDEWALREQVAARIAARYA